MSALSPRHPSSRSATRRNTAGYVAPPLRCTLRPSSVLVASRGSTGSAAWGGQRGGL